LGPRQRESDPGLLEHGLIDEFRLWIFPLMLRKGKPLFEADIDRSIRLAGSRTTDSGLAVLTYEPAGGLAFGSVDDPRGP
jgi:dihydrofolate reductase